MLDNDKLDEIMKKQGLSSGSLAEKIGVSKVFVSYLVRGLKQPSLEVHTRICDVLGITTDELIKR